MKEVTGDILALAQRGEFDLVIQGCNCEGSMGAGLAKQIKEDYPAAFEADQRLSGTPEQRLGGVVGVTVVSKSNPAITFTILNGYTQLKARSATRGERLADYDAIRSVFKTVASNFPNYRIAYPKIGAGRAHGDWVIIEKIIDEELAGLDHTLVVFDENSATGSTAKVTPGGNAMQHPATVSGTI